jgi:threonine synthase
MERNKRTHYPPLAREREALDREPERPAGYADIESLPQRFEVMPADVDRIKGYIAQHTGL